MHRGGVSVWNTGREAKRGGGTRGHPNCKIQCQIMTHTHSQSTRHPYIYIYIYNPPRGNACRYWTCLRDDHNVKRSRVVGTVRACAQGTFTPAPAAQVICGPWGRRAPGDRSIQVMHYCTTIVRFSVPSPHLMPPLWGSNHISWPRSHAEIAASSPPPLSYRSRLCVGLTFPPSLPPPPLVAGSARLS